MAGYFKFYLANFKFRQAKFEISIPLYEVSANKKSDPKKSRFHNLIDLS